LINVQQSLPRLLTLLSFGCFPRPFYQVNELNGRRQPRLFVLLSDILIYATPRKRRPLRPGFSGLRERRKQARVTPRLTTVGRCRPLQDIHKVGAGQSSLYRHGTSHGVWFRRRMRRGFAYPPFERAWLDSVARPNPSQAHECPVDLLASRNVRFTCISVYPLHHCQIQPHFPLDSKQTDFVERSYSHLMFIDDKPVGRSSEHRTHLTFNANMDDTVVSRTCAVMPSHTRDCVYPSTPMSLDLGCLSLERNAFTVTCRDASFTVDFDDRSTAENWVLSLDTAINAVRMARQSLRKASSAKRPMPVADFVSYEHWLWRTDHPAPNPPNSIQSRACTLTESLGLHERNGLSGWLDSGRRLINSCHWLTSPFTNLRDNGKAYVIDSVDAVPRSRLSCLRSKSCSPLNSCMSNERTQSELFCPPYKQNSVQLIGVRTQNGEQRDLPALQWSELGYDSFDECSPTFASLPAADNRESLQHSGPSSPFHPGQLDSSGIASGCSISTRTYASVVDHDISSQPVVSSARNQCKK
ncbi:hypothetical protein FBUS_08558, partial [Fasciolopsis buskii]